MKAEYVDHMGDDLSVVNAARVSFAKRSEWQWDHIEEVYYVDGDDKSLISFLAKHNHWTPFAHTAITLRMSAPLPIRTQCFKHKAGFVENEESRRYISRTPEPFWPVWRQKADKVKQGSGEEFDTFHREMFDGMYRAVVKDAIANYESMIARGVCPEQARFVLPQGCEVEWVWTGNLASYARFYRQRTDPHAQREVTDLALMVGKIIEPLFPLSWKALTNG